MTEKLAEGVSRAWRDWLRSALILVVAITALRSAVADWNDVPTGSMKPTIVEGDRIVVLKAAYDLKLPYTRWRLLTWGAPQRGDIVILRSPVDGVRLVKRVVGLPGDLLEISEGRLVVNGEPLQYRLPAPGFEAGFDPAENPGAMVVIEDMRRVEHPVMLSSTVSKCAGYGPAVVPANHYFVMGDNRGASLDSRHFGFVDRTLVLGRAVAVAASVDPDRWFMPRWERFFHALQ